MAEGRKRGQSAGLTRERVLRAAREVVDVHGVDGLSMRAVARHLAVTPNALYAHVDNRNDLIDALLDDVLADVVKPSPRAADPTNAVRRVMTSTYSVLLESGSLAPLFLARRGSRGPNAVALGKVMDELLQRMGVREVDTARSALIVHAIGSAAFVTADGSAARPISARAARQRFDEALDWLLTGMAS